MTSAGSGRRFSPLFDAGGCHGLQLELQAGCSESEVALAVLPCSQIFRVVDPPLEGQEAGGSERFYLGDQTHVRLEARTCSDWDACSVPVQVGDCAVYLWATKGCNLVYKLAVGSKQSPQVLGTVWPNFSVCPGLSLTVESRAQVTALGEEVQWTRPLRPEPPTPSSVIPQFSLC